MISAVGSTDRTDALGSLIVHAPNAKPINTASNQLRSSIIAFLQLFGQVLRRARTIIADEMQAACQARATVLRNPPSNNGETARQLLVSPDHRPDNSSQYRFRACCNSVCWLGGQDSASIPLLGR